MRAKAGDRLIVRGHAIGDKERDAEILEVRGPGGTPPFVVRWDDSGHETLFFPGSDAIVQHLGAEQVVDLDAGPGVGDAVRTEHHHLLAGVQHLLDAADALDDAEVVPDAVHEVLAFLRDDILPHAHAEDGTLYAKVDELVGSPEATRPMRRQHEEIERLVERLGRLRDEGLPTLEATTRRNLRQVLHALHAILSLHLATEEEQYVPLLEARLSPQQSAALAEEMAAAEASPPTAVVEV